MDIFGTLGALLIIIAWLPPTIIAIKRGRSTMNLWFQIIYFVGSAFLTYYSFSQGDWIFTLLNFTGMTLAFVNIQYIPNKMKKVESEIHEIEGRKNKKYYHVKKK